MPTSSRATPRFTAGVLIAGAAALALALACHRPPKTPDTVIENNIADMRATIAKAVTDPARAAALDGEVDRLVELLDELSASTRTFAHDIQALNSKHGATQAEFTELYTRFEAERVRMRDEVVAVHFALLSQTTASEWKKISDHEKQAVMAAGSTDVRTKQ